MVSRRVPRGSRLHLHVRVLIRLRLPGRITGPLWAAQLLSAIGDQIYLLALVTWAVDTLGTRASWILALDVTAAIAASLWMGVLVDRANRRTLLLWADLARAIALAALALSARHSLHIAAVAATAVVLGVGGAAFSPALRASLPDLVTDGGELQSLNGWLDVNRRIARVVGPAVAAALLALLSVAALMAADAVSFLLSAIAVWYVGRVVRGWGVPRAPLPARGSMAAELREGLAAVGEHEHLPGLMWLAALTGVVWGAAFTAGVPLLCARAFGGAVRFGYLLAAYGVGNVAANIVVSSMRIERRTHAIYVGRVLHGAGLVALALSPTIGVAAIAAAIAATGGPPGDLMMTLRIQDEVPDRKRGRVFSVYMLLGGAGYSVGLAVAVPLMSVLSVRWSIVLLSFPLVVMGAVGAYRTRRVRERGVPAVEDAARA